MKICFDARPYFFRSGVGAFVRGLLPELAAGGAEHDFTVFISSQQSPETFPLDEPNVKLVVSAAEWEAPDSSQAFASEADAAGADVCFMPFLLEPVRTQTPLVITAHDILPVLHPEFFPAHIASKFSAASMRGAFRAAARILCDSRCTRDDIARVFKLPEDRLDVVPLGVSDAFHPRAWNDTAPVMEKYGLEFENYILYVGVVEPRKNLDMLLRAYEGLTAGPGPWMPLIIAGRKGWNVDHVYEAAAQKPLSNWVRFLDFVPETDLPALYSSAALFVYPSLYEGFGLPVLEALASGRAVIASNASSIPEITGPGGARLVPPDDEAALARAMEELLENPDARTELGLHAAERARIFSWHNTAQLVLEALIKTASAT